MLDKLVYLFVVFFTLQTFSFQHDDYYWKISQILIDSSIRNSDISKLEYLCDTFGPRFCGTQNLEDALDWILEKMKEENLENVRTERVDGITHWVRGKESLTLLEPRVHSMALLGLGNSIGTGKDGITGEGFVVSTFEELYANAEKAKGKIIIFNAPFEGYETASYRVFGASAAATVGGLAALVRSVTPYSLYTPHTGGMWYSDDVPKIPTACITVEDSEMLARMQKRGQKIKLNLYMEAETKEPITSRNILADITGREKPDEIVLFGGHTDSWDVGQGAVDDGGGFFSAWEAFRIINDLILQNKIPKPRRTIRLIGWVNEELGAMGALTYVMDHVKQLSNHILAIESDNGNFHPIGFGFSGTEKGLAVMMNISKLLAPIGASDIFMNDGIDEDNGFLEREGVPSASLKSLGTSGKVSDELFYFNYHHSHADTITALNREGLKNSVACMAVLAYVAADLEYSVRNGTTTKY